ncbi:translation initiation factor eIF-3 subunit D [Gymnopus androsaceus JB14]|uniref:Eukaryotic translation initiation factor 3 subunit D n=1 Tax=Gymnopus androsaceus JB14 TaxID=1447944 RepID=A0A6A4IF64_9AGAR|nr:translation initiation factor eIF-3 subunit D [Gymnopus androsaceus JB14]
MSFSLPPINDNPDGGWGPSSSNLPDQFKFKDIPYAPYSKSDKLGRFADWNETTSDTRQSAVGVPSTQNTRTGPGGRRREGTQAFGSGTASAFAYFHVEDESSFSLVDNKAAPARRGGTFARGRGNARGGAGNYNARGTGQRGGRGGFVSGRGGNAQRGGRRGWRDWEKNTRTRESSVVISPQWSMLEEIEFHRLAKLRLEVEEPENIDSYGRLFAYDKSFDRITTKTEKPLQQSDRIKYNTTTSDDPVIQQLVSKNTATIYTTDVILSVLMCAPRSVYPWDIVIVREGNSLFFDKRDGGPFDTVTVNENAADPPQDPPPPNPNNPNEKAPEAPSINSATSLSLEATYVNQNFAFQSVVESSPPPAVDFAHPNPFYGPDETEPLASCGYRYRVFDLSVHEDEDVKICVRTEVDAYLPGAGNAREGQGLVTIRALNEFDPRAVGAGGAPDWRTKLDSQRGAVVATEMKNNSCKLAKWAVQSILAGADLMKIGYVSRSNPRDAARHVILSTASMRPTDFAGQLNVSLANGWGIVRTVADLCMKMPEGKYVLVKDPNKPVIRLYAIPASTFSGEDEDGEAFEEDDVGI